MPTVTKAKKKATKRTKSDDFESVAKRLGCDMDDATFRKQLGKIARAKPLSKQPRRKI